MDEKLNTGFYKRSNLVVAKELLGKIFVFQDKISNKKLSAKIVEVEAYDGNIDKAAHTFNGKTERNKIMFEEGGYLYVYFTYGKHFCANVVTGKKNHGTAVLLRAMEPITGLETFALRRFGKMNITKKQYLHLLNGPAKICQSFGIGRENNCSNLVSDDIYLLKAPKIPKSRIVTTTRIGIKKSVELPWRYYIKDSPYVSRLK